MITTFIATLGSEPQVVTLALDLLRDRDRAPQAALVLHTWAGREPMRSALARLAEEMPAYPSIRYTPVLMCDDQGRPLADVDTPEDAASYFRGVYQALRGVKRAGGPVDVCLAGGRKTMSAYAMAAAQLLFEEGDRLWHLVSASDLLAARRMHPQPGDHTALVELPVLRYADVLPVFSGAAAADDPFQALQRGEARARAQRIRAARAFLRHELTEAEQRVASLLAREGLSDEEIAGRLYLSPRTVQSHLASAYRKAADYFGLEQVTARMLVSLLAEA